MNKYFDHLCFAYETVQDNIKSNHIFEVYISVRQLLYLMYHDQYMSIHNNHVTHQEMYNSIYEPGKNM